MNAILRLNPELRRNLWLELTPLRLWATPFAILLLFMFYAAGFGRGWRDEVFQTGHFVILIAVATWGARKAADAVAVELRERTWDQQRLSGLGPGGLTLGKIFGAPSLAWMVILYCLLAQAFALVAPVSAPAPRTVLFGVFEPDGLVLIAEVAGAFALFASAFFAALTAQSGQERPRAFDATLFQVAAVFAGMMLVMLILAESSRANIDAPRLAEWHGLALAPSLMLALCFAMFGLWAAYGAYHQLRRAFAMATTAGPWILFIVFFALFAAGWEHENSLGVAAVSVAVLTYASALIEPQKVVEYRVWLSRLVQMRPAALLTAPAWFYAWAATFVLALALILQPDAKEAFAIDDELGDAIRGASGPSAATAMLAAVAFMARDMGLCVWAGLRASDGRGLWAAALMLALLWGVAPALYGHLVEGWRNSLFLPGGAVSLVSALVQTAIAFVLVAGQIAKPAPRRATKGEEAWRKS